MAADGPIVARPMPHDATRRLIREQGPLLGLIAVIFALFFLQELRGREWYLPFMAVPASIVESWHDLRAGVATAGDFRTLGTLLSYAFFHGDAEHVVFNMLFLWIFAALIAELLGHRWMLGIFIVTAITGGLFHVALNAGKMIPMLGASGALMGFQGAYLGLATRWHLPDPHIWPMARPVPPGQLALIGVIGVVIDYTSLMGHAPDNIAYGAHLGGFVGGLVLAALAAPKPHGACHR
jgi:membrane associated rhomboid family serine protease